VTPITISNSLDIDPNASLEIGGTAYPMSQPDVVLFDYSMGSLTGSSFGSVTVPYGFVEFDTAAQQII